MARRSRWVPIIVAVLVACTLISICSVGGVLAWRHLAGGSEFSSEFLDLFSSSESISSDRSVLRLWGAEPVTLDPALVTDAYSAEYVVEIFSGLVMLNQQMEVVPDIAESWVVSSDGRTYTFLLRPEVRFHDGKLVTAGDFKYSFERACDPSLSSPVAMTYLGDIIGVPEKVRGIASEIEGVRVLDDHTLEITIDQPKAYFLAKLTYSTAFVVDQDDLGLAPASSSWQPNGTGAFRLHSQSSESIVLVRNEHFYGETPALETVEYILSGGDPVSMYEDGQLQITELGFESVERARDPFNPLHDQLRIIPQLDVQYLGMNTTMPPFDDPKVRRAFALAIDRDKLAQVVLNDTVIPAKGILPPGMPGYNANLEGLPFDPEGARKLLSESSYGGAATLPPVTLHLGGDSGILAGTIEAILAMCQDNLGIELLVEETPWPDFLQDVQQGRCQMFSLGWIGDFPDPQNFLDVLFHSQSDNNHTFYRNPAVDELLELARVEPDMEERGILYQKVEEIIISDAPWVPLWHGNEYLLVKPDVVGVGDAPTITPWLRSAAIQE